MFSGPFFSPPFLLRQSILHRNTRILKSCSAVVYNIFSKRRLVSLRNYGIFPQYRKQQRKKVNMSGCEQSFPPVHSLPLPSNYLRFLDLPEKSFITDKFPHKIFLTVPKDNTQALKRNISAEE